MNDVVDTAQEALEKAAEDNHDALHNLVAILVALSATFMALCNVKDGNVVQAMAQHQAQAVDAWSYYQSKSTKQHLAESTAEQLRVQRELNPPARDKAPRLDALIAKHEAQAARYEQEKEQISREALGHERAYADLNVHDDQFDMAEALLSVALAMYGITALTKKRWLLGVAFAFSATGILLGLAGFLGWNLHPEWLAKLLG